MTEKLKGELKLEREQHKKALNTIALLNKDLTKSEKMIEYLLIKLEMKEQTISILIDIIKSIILWNKK